MRIGAATRYKLQPQQKGKVMKKGILASLLAMCGLGSFGRQSFGADINAGFNEQLPKHVKRYGRQKANKKEFKGREKFDLLQSGGNGTGLFKSRQTGEIKTMQIYKRHDFTKGHQEHYGLQTV